MITLASLTARVNLEPSKKEMKMLLNLLCFLLATSFICREAEAVEIKKEFVNLQSFLWKINIASNPLGAYALPYNILSIKDSAFVRNVSIGDSLERCISHANRAEFDELQNKLVKMQEGKSATEKEIATIKDRIKGRFISLIRESMNPSMKEIKSKNELITVTEFLEKISSFKYADGSDFNADLSVVIKLPIWIEIFVFDNFRSAATQSYINTVFKGTNLMNHELIPMSLPHFTESSLKDYLAGKPVTVRATPQANFLKDLYQKSENQPGQKVSVPKAKTFENRLDDLLSRNVLLKNHSEILKALELNEKTLREDKGEIGQMLAELTGLSPNTGIGLIKLIKRSLEIE